MKYTYEEEVRKIEEILCKADQGEISDMEAVERMMKLTLKYKNKRIKELISSGKEFKGVK